MKQKEIMVNPDNLYTKQEYSVAFNISRPTIDKQIQTKELKTLVAKGTVLIIAK